MTDAEKYFNTGLAAWRSGQINQSIAAFQRCLERSPDSVPALCNLGAALQAARRTQEAIDCYRRVLAIDPYHAESHNNLGVCLFFCNDFDAAIQSYRRAIGIDPKDASAYQNLAQALCAQGHLDDCLAMYDRAMAVNPKDYAAASNRLFTLQFHPDCDPKSLLSEARLWSQRYAEPLGRLIEPLTVDRAPDRPLRIGYVTPNLRTHSQAPFIYPLLKFHDRRNFQIFCYAGVLLPDAITPRFQACADVWRSSLGQSHRDLAVTIRRDKIDILVDLTLHMAHGRLLTFAQKPAPIQVTYLAYPGTTGLSTIDYRLTDAWLDPDGVTDDCYTERSIRLADTFACFDPTFLDPETPVAPLPAEANGYITFGSLANFFKTNKPLLSLWSRVLRNTPRSHLRLLAPEGEARRWVTQALSEHGVATDRIKFVHRQSRPRYIAEHSRIDICLDTLPYNGHTTTLEAIWHGVPIVTRLGITAGGRAGWSVLNNLGLPELAGQTDDQYVQIATDLAADLPRLAELRRSLRERMRRSPLADGPRFAAAVEAAYRTMWRDFISR